MWQLRRYLYPYRKQAILGAIFKFVEVICELLLPSIMAFVIDQGIKRHNQALVWRYGLLMIAMALLGFSSALVCQYFAARSAQGYGTDLRRDLYQKINTLSYQQQDQIGTATLTTRLTNDINQLQLWNAMMIRQVSRAPFMILGALLMAFILDRHLAIILLIATPLLAFVVYELTQKMSPLYRRYQKQLDQLSGFVKSNLSGVRVIRAFDKGEAQKQKFTADNNQLTQTGLHIGRLSALYNPLTATIVNLMIVVILWVSGDRVNQGWLAQGTVLAFVNYVNMILAAILMLSNLVILLTKALASGERVQEIMALPLAANQKTSSPKKTQSQQSASQEDDTSLALQQVSFYYPDEQGDYGEPALQQIDLTAHPGETIGIIGGTGAGKSTLLNLLPRFYDYQKGEINLQGRNLRDYDVADLRRQFAIVPQQTTLFSGTVASNLRWGHEDTSDDALWQALTTAQAADFVRELPQQLVAPVERGGHNFSGGQQQRLEIARALVKQAPFVLLDDATSALDYLTEAHFLQALQQQSWTTNILLVTQRIGTVEHCDRVLVLKNGTAVGFDTASELLKHNHYYQQLAASQLDQDQAGEQHDGI